MHKELVIPNSRGQTIKGTLKINDPKMPLLIVCHGFHSSKNNPTLVAITDMLLKKGLNSYSFTFPSDAQGFSLAPQVQDISCVALYFSQFRPIICLATSFGVLAGFIACATNQSIKGFITLNGFFGKPFLGPTYLRRYLFFRICALFPGVYRNNWLYFKKQFVPKTFFKPTLVLHAKNDTEVSIRQSREFYETLSTTKKQFFALSGGDHQLQTPSAREKTVAIIAHFVKETFTKKVTAIA